MVAFGFWLQTVALQQPSFQWDGGLSASFILLLAVVVLLLAFFHYRHTRRIESGRFSLEQELSAAKLALEQAGAELQQAKEKIQTLRLQDPLTGLKNRRFITEFLEKDIAYVLRDYTASQTLSQRRTHFYFVVIELDNLGQINKTYGNAAGDFVLKSFAKLLLDCIRKADIPVRWGGSEFLVVCRQCQRHQAHRIAARICQNLEAAKFNWAEDVTLKTTCSIGYSPFPMLTHRPDVVGWDQVIQIAKKALSYAREAGGNTFFGIYSKIKDEFPNGSLPPVSPDAFNKGYFHLVEADNILQLEDI